MFEKGLEGMVGLCYNFGSDEKLVSVGVMVVLGSQFVLWVEGLKCEVNDYIVLNYFYEYEGEFEKERCVGNIFVKGEIVSVGGLWIGECSFVGIVYINC